MSVQDQQAIQEFVKRKRAIIYCRVNSERQKQDGESLEYQEERCRQWAEANNIQVIVVLAEAKSGYIHYSYRGKLTLARQMIRDHVADMIIVWDLRRFSRNFVHSAMIFQEIESYGGEVISVSENIDNSLTGKLIRSVLAWCAESEREKINEYANRHWQKRHELELPMATSTPPYGWQWGDKTKTFYGLNIEEAAVRRSLFEMFVELDMSIRQIGHKLTIDGIRTPREARKEPLNGDKKLAALENGKPKLIPWTTGTISQYLRDVANLGTLVICKQKRVLLENGKTKHIVHPDQKVIPGAMPAIVSPELFERAQRKLATNRETKSQRPRDPESFLLVGHVYCAICGYRMRPAWDKKLPVYRCTKHISIYDANPHQCEPHIQRIRTSLLDPAVWQDCCHLFERLEPIQATIEAEIKNSINNLLEDTTGREQIAALKLAIEHASQEHAKQQNEYLRSLIAQDIQAKLEQLERFEAECKAANGIAALTATYQQRVLEFIEFVNVMRGRYHEATFQEKRNVLNVLGVKVHVHPDVKGTPPLPPVETDQEWLSISEASELTGIHRNSLMLHVHNGDLKSQKMATSHFIFHRDEITRYLKEKKQKVVDLSQYEDEWFTMHRLVAVLRVTTWRILNEAISQGEVEFSTKDIMRTYIHRDELNRFLQESPIKLRSLVEDVSDRIKITYSPLFVGTGVQTSKDASKSSTSSTTPVLRSWSCA
ncbi:recombinase family protein [Ktedonobacter racemifer]|uniref:Resolvase domain protein n=1 Tax=Ktedonobacter racemifer DSM 44963 TaxID=485913 RepID=D6TES1_KTERA|nr:recombinase family protein [Ktedonobacter racemifer]EFH88520.1 Resolvase domain protein [Ktedonobacter racemifer DSM 44963]